jgi:hypothetical protein
VAEEEDGPFDQDFRNGQGASPPDDQEQLRTACWTRPPLPVRASRAGADLGLETLIARGGQVAIALLLCDRCKCPQVPPLATALLVPRWLS